MLPLHMDELHSLVSIVVKLMQFSETSRHFLVRFCFSQVQLDHDNHVVVSKRQRGRLLQGWYIG